MVTGKYFIFSGCRSDDSSHPIGIRVRSDQQIGSRLFAQFDRHRKRLALLRIRRFHGGEVRVRLLLLFHDVHLREAQLLQYAAHRHITCAMKRRKDDDQLFGRSRQKQLPVHAGAGNRLRKRLILRFA